MIQGNRNNRLHIKEWHSIMFIRPEPLTVGARQMNRAFVVGVLSATVLGISSAAAQIWKKAERSDPLRGTQFLHYSLDGKYLTPPRNAAADAAPAIIVRCVPGARAHGHLRGKFLEGYIFVGGVVDTHIVYDASARASVELRLDDRKLEDAYWGHSTDFSSLFFGSTDLNNLLYSHLLYHKENTSPQVRKIVLGVPEFLGGEVVMQFDMPDAAEVGDACGVIWHK